MRIARKTRRDAQIRSESPACCLQARYGRAALLNVSQTLRASLNGTTRPRARISTSTKPTSSSFPSAVNQSTTRALSAPSVRLWMSVDLGRSSRTTTFTESGVEPRGASASGYGASLRRCRKESPRRRGKTSGGRSPTSLTCRTRSTSQLAAPASAPTARRFAGERLRARASTLSRRQRFKSNENGAGAPMYRRPPPAGFCRV